MSVKVRDLDGCICYIFNGRDFLVNTGLPDGEFIKVLACCLENDPDQGADKEKSKDFKGSPGMD